MPSHPGMKVEVVIPYRDRGSDPLRPANLKRVLEHWATFDAPVTVVSDGLDGDQPFNRSQAYNYAIRSSDADIFVLTEADMLIDHEQIHRGIYAATQPGVVIPFTQRNELTPEHSELVRTGTPPTPRMPADIKYAPRRIGAINIISRHTYNQVGQFDPAMLGNWWDDRSMELAFEMCTAPTRWIDANGQAFTKTELRTGTPQPAVAYHLYHLPGHAGTHLTSEDRAATASNQQRFKRYRRAQTPEQIRHLTAGN